MATPDQLEADAATLDSLAAHLGMALEQVADLDHLSNMIKRRLENQIKNLKAEAIYLARGLRIAAKQ